MEHRYCYACGVKLGTEGHESNHAPKDGQKDFFCVICGRSLKDHEKDQKWEWKDGSPSCLPSCYARDQKEGRP